MCNVQWIRAITNFSIANLNIENLDLINLLLSKKIKHQILWDFEFKKQIAQTRPEYEAAETNQKKWTCHRVKSSWLHS